MMFGLRVIASIHRDKYSEFIESIGCHSPQSPLSFFHIYTYPIDEHLLNIITECSSLEPLTDYIQTQCFKDLVGVINLLGSLQGIKMEQYSKSS